MDPITQAVKYLQSQAEEKVDLAIICGSGLSGLSDDIEDARVVPYSRIPNFPRTSVQGHKDELVFGRLGGRYVAAMRGRFHLYEGHDPSTVAFPIRCLAALGARVLVVTNAAGTMNEDFSVGDFVLLKDHISFPGMAAMNPLCGPNDDRFGPRFPALTHTYDEALRDVAHRVAHTQGIHDRMREGIYFNVLGPSYETSHELSLMRQVGADMVGMSTAPEIIAAGHCGMSVLGISLVTNLCLLPGRDIPAPSHEEVLAAVSDAGTVMRELVRGIAGQLDLDRYEDPRAHVHFREIAREPCPTACTCPCCAAEGGSCCGGQCACPACSCCSRPGQPSANRKRPCCGGNGGKMAAKTAKNKKQPCCGGGPRRVPGGAGRGDGSCPTACTCPCCASGACCEGDCQCASCTCCSTNAGCGGACGCTCVCCVSGGGCSGNCDCVSCKCCGNATGSWASCVRRDVVLTSSLAAFVGVIAGVAFARRYQRPG